MKSIKFLYNFLKKRSTPAFYDIYGGDRDKYMARHIIMERMEKTLDGDGIKANSKHRVHLICTAADSLMLNIARQAALLCHFPNFNEENPKNRTKITILAPEVKNENDLIEMHKMMSSKNLFGNLLAECQWKMKIHNTPVSMKGDKVKSFIDVEVEVVGFGDNSIDAFLNGFQPSCDELTTVVAYPGDIQAKELEKLRGKCLQVHILDYVNQDILMAVDVRKARRANIVYERGVNDRNIFNNNVKDAIAYEKLLRKMIKSISLRDEENSWNDPNMTEVNKLSSLCCSDCYSYYLRSVCTPGKDATQSILENIDVMGKTEHARWNVEKLITGFRPLNEREMYEDASKSGKEQKTYRQEKKKEKVHIDLCSIRRLTSVDPDSLKYDSFLVLAIPSILESLKR